MAVHKVHNSVNAVHIVHNGLRSDGWRGGYPSPVARVSSVPFARSEQIQ
jgi:hypothetical protein